MREKAMLSARPRTRVLARTTRKVALEVPARLNGTSRANAGVVRKSRSGKTSISAPFFFWGAVNSGGCQWNRQREFVGRR